MPISGQSQATHVINIMSTIPKSAGAFYVRRDKVTIRGKTVRTATLVFTTTDGYVGEAPVKNGRFDHQLAYKRALEARATAQLAARTAAANVTPTSAWERCNKPAPVAQLLNAISESMLFTEVERRGYEVALP